MQFEDGRLINLWRHERIGATALWRYDAAGAGHES
jgi:hypothetical protein